MFITLDMMDAIRFDMISIPLLLIGIFAAAVCIAVDVNEMKKGRK